MFQINSMASWTLEQVLYFMLGSVQTDGSVHFFLRMKESFSIGPDSKWKPKTGWMISFDQNLNANVALELRAALNGYGLKMDFYPREKRGSIRFNRKRDVHYLFKVLDRIITKPWFIGHKSRNVIIMRYVLEHNVNLTGAALVGLYFSQHKTKTSDLDTLKRKWTRKVVCDTLNLSLNQVEKACASILTQIDEDYRQF